ncbi:major facilitator superfamily domain-containing protein [Cyathus striatus]|nr:major facilitator superfamily domain-containing protein [Cyathus striatus]
MQTHNTLDVTTIEDVETALDRKDVENLASSEKSLNGRAVTPIQITGQESRTVSEGGLHGWLTLVGVCLFQYCTFGYVGTFGVYQDYYVRIYLTNYTPDEIGWIGGVQIFFLFSIGAISGRLFDRGFFKSLLFTSVVLHAVACEYFDILFTLSASHQNKYYQVFLSHGLCFGLSCGVVYVPSLGVLSHYFRRRRPVAMGIASAAAALGAVLHPIMLNKLINGPIGFHNGVRISAALNVFLLIVASLIMRPGLSPAAPGIVKKPNVTEFFKDPPYVAILIAGILAFCGIFFPLFFIQLDAITHGVEKNLAFYAISIQNAASIFGRTLPGVFAHKVGVFKLMAVATFGTGVSALCMAAVKDATGLILFAVFYGLFSGGAIALGPIMIAMISKDVNEIGTRIGIYFFFGGLLGLFAIPIAGALLTDQFHWIRAILFAGFMLWGAGIFYCLAGYLLVKRQAAQNS